MTLLQKVFSDLKTHELVDYHVHPFGFSFDPEQDVYVNPKIKKWFHPIDYARGVVFSWALDINTKILSKENVTSLISKKLIEMIENFKNEKNERVPLKCCLFAFDKAYEKNGDVDLEKTEMYVSNNYVFDLYEKHPDYFYPVISVHPYRHDALEQLDIYYKKGARIIKWLPNSMSIDPSSDLCTAFYEFMQKKKMILLSHTGIEMAFKAHGEQRFGNPLYLKKPLEMGIKVIAAHCATEGRGVDLEAKSQNRMSYFDLWVRLMKRYQNFYGDISALTQIQRIGKLKSLLELQDLHPRLVNGSDWPLPSVGFVVSTYLYKQLGFITKDERRELNLIYQKNPLLFDFALKRTLRHPAFPDLQFQPSVFEKNPELVPFA